MAEERADALEVYADEAELYQSEVGWGEPTRLQDAFNEAADVEAMRREARRLREEARRIRREEM